MSLSSILSSVHSRTTHEPFPDALPIGFHYLGKMKTEAGLSQTVPSPMTWVRMGIQRHHCLGVSQSVSTGTSAQLRPSLHSLQTCSCSPPKGSPFTNGCLGFGWESLLQRKVQNWRGVLDTRV